MRWTPLSLAMLAACAADTPELNPPAQTGPSCVGLIVRSIPANLPGITRILVPWTDGWSYMGNVERFDGALVFVDAYRHDGQIGSVQFNGPSCRWQDQVIVSCADLGCSAAASGTCSGTPCE